MPPIAPDHPSSAAERAGRSGVKASLTPKRRRRSVENDEYASSSAASPAPTPAGSRPVTLTPWPT